MFWGGLKCPLFVLCPPMRISSDAFQREAEPDPVCDQWRPPVGVVLWSQSHPHPMSADTKSCKIFEFDIVHVNILYLLFYQHNVLLQIRRILTKREHPLLSSIIRHGGPVECGHQSHQQLPRAPQSLYWQLGVQVVLQVYHQSTSPLLSPDICQVSVI